MVKRSASKEHYVIDICDRVLGMTAKRNKGNFEFLRGDPGANGKAGAKLRVDAYYPDLDLVVEFNEKQHYESVPFFDRRKTRSGCDRGEQRRRYDERHRIELLAHGVDLVVIEHHVITGDQVADEKVIRSKLARYRR